MLAYYLSEMIYLVKMWSGMSIMIMLVIWTNDSQPPNIYLLWLEDQSVGNLLQFTVALSTTEAEYMIIT